MTQSTHTAAGGTLVASGRRLASRCGRWLASAGWALLPLLVAVYLGLGLDRSGFVPRLRDLVFDQYQRWSPRPWTPDGPVRVVAVDNESLARHGQWPWPHSAYSLLLDRLTKAGAAVVAFDIVFADPDRLAHGEILRRLPDLPEREALARAMQEQGLLDQNDLAAAIARAPTVLGYVLSSTGTHAGTPAKWGMATAGDDPRPFLPQSPRAIPPLADLAKAARGLGAFNMAPDHDLLVRRIPLLFALGDTTSDMTGARTDETRQAAIVPSLAAEALRVAQGASTYIVRASNASGQTGFGAQTGVTAVRIGNFEIPTDANGAVRVHYAGSKEDRHIAAWRVLAGEFDPDEVAGRIVLVGASASALADFRATPLEQAAPGVDTHAEMIEQIVAGQHLVRPDYARGLELWTLLLGAALLAIVLRRARAVTAGVVTLALVAGAGAASWFAFTHAGFLFDPLTPGLTWLATAGLGLVAAYRRAERDKRFVRNAFSRYLSPAIVERIAADPTQLRLGGETRTVTILFSDVRDFTARAEGLEADAVVRFLNALHTPFTGAVMAERGTIDKYIGDGLMAFWNAPLDVERHADRACAAALAMLALVPQIDRALAEEAAGAGLPHRPLRIGIGVNTGDAFVGNMGSDQRFDYSVVGDAVNIAARLEAATKELGCPVIVSQATRDAAADHLFVSLGATGLKGKTTETRMHALIGPLSDLTPKIEEFMRLHEAVLAQAESGGPQLAAAIATARAHPAAAQFEAFYAGLAQRRQI